jgi:glycosyltransferase involved in cell wall biosynthesis
MDLLNGMNCFVAWVAGVPVRISHSHTSASQYEKKTGRHFVSRLYRGCMKLLGWVFSNRKCGCSDVAMDYLFGTGWKGQKNTAVINNGVDLSRFRCSAEKASDRKHIVSVGRLCEAKNPLFALEVMDALRRLRTDFVYEWIGDGELRKQMEEAIAEKGLQDHVRLLGVRNDIEKLLPARDLFFMPSLFEGLPVSLIEAQSAGLACLISDTITREVNCGACAFHPLEAPAADWAKALSDILDGKHTLAADPEKLRKFDISYTIEQLEQVYNR